MQGMKGASGKSLCYNICSTTAGPSPCCLLSGTPSPRLPLPCCRSKLESVPPLLPEGVHHSDPAWQRINIKYVESGAGG